MNRMFKTFSILLVTALLLAACSPTNAVTTKDGVAMASMEGMPDAVKRSAQTVQTAYQYALANADLLKQIPCYCGCGSAGHHSNYACYVADDSGDSIEYDMHATGCSICVDITLDAMRMKKSGKSVDEIKTTIDQTYARFGPSNMP